MVNIMLMVNITMVNPDDNDKPIFLKPVYIIYKCFQSFYLNSTDIMVSNKFPTFSIELL